MLLVAVLWVAFTARLRPWDDGLTFGTTAYSRNRSAGITDVLKKTTVTTDGNHVVEANAYNDRDLFWALRDGGGTWDIVTLLSHKPGPLPSDNSTNPVLALQLPLVIFSARQVAHGWLSPTRVGPVQRSTLTTFPTSLLIFPTPSSKYLPQDGTLAVSLQ